MAPAKPDQPQTTEAKSSRAAEKVAFELASALLRGRFPEGTMLLPGPDLCRVANCSQTALRGAIHLLETWGLVAVLPGRNGGTVVREPRPDDLRFPVATLIHSQNALFSDVLVARRAIDPLLAAEAARNRTDQEVFELRALCERARESVGFRDNFSSAITDFDQGLASAAGMPVLGVFLWQLTSLGDEVVNRIAPSSQTRRLRTARAYERVLDAIELSDPDTAEAEMAAWRLEVEGFWKQSAPYLLEIPLRPLAYMES